MTMENKVLIAAIVIVVINIVTYVSLIYDKIEIKRREKERRHRIASDKNGRCIWHDSNVIYRGKKCKVFWDDKLLTFYLVPEDGNVMHGIPFTTYVAKECDVTR